MTYETAQQLMGAVIYCIDEYERGEPENSTALVDVNLSCAAREAYDRGYALVVAKAETVLRRYEDMISDFQWFGNLAYRETVVDGMTEFFKWYDPRFNPQEHLLTLDYPLLVRLDGLQGIDLIDEYLKCIQLEQRFLKQLPDGYVTAVLRDYHRGCDILIINVADILLRKILLNAMLGSEELQVHVSRGDFETVHHMIAQMDGELIQKEIGDLLEQLVRSAFSEDHQLLWYLQGGLPDFISDLMHGRKYDG